MSKRILLGIDTNFSPTTQHAVRAVGEFMEQATSQLHLVLLSVIPVPSMASPSLGMYVGHLLPMSITPEQRNQAEDALRLARSELQKGGIAPGQIEVLIRIGFPADEIVKVAKELHVNFIVVGSHAASLRQKIQRFLAGSTSRSVLRHYNRLPARAYQLAHSVYPSRGSPKVCATPQESAWAQGDSSCGARPGTADRHRHSLPAQCQR